MTRLASAVAVGLLAAAVPSAPAAEQAKIDEAIRKGAEYLQKSANGAGTGGGEHYGSGAMALAGMAMMEAGVKPSDPAIQAIAAAVRTSSAAEGGTYQVALGILFLDRLGESIDVPMIQILGCRLLAGQTAAGGWSYQTFTTAEADANLIRAALYPPGRAGKGGGGGGAGGGDDDPPAGDAPKVPKLHPIADRMYQAVRKGARSDASRGGSDDNSNTQFGIIGLWVAKRKGVPVSDAVRLIDARFLRSQSPTDFGWGYTGMGSGSSPSMTCAGLLGLAVGKAVAEAKKPPPTNAGGKDDDPFYKPPLPGQADDEDGPKADKVPSSPRDIAIKNGLAGIGRLIGGGGGAGGISPVGVTAGWGGVGDLYFMWSLERVAVAFGLETIADVDWYKWGCDRILPAQKPDGSWGGSYSNTVDTSFALLFLCKSNFVADLTRDLGGKVKDPGGGLLRGTRGGPLAISSAGRRPDEPRAPGAPAPVGPGLGAVDPAGEVDRITKILVEADDAKWPKALDEARKRKGGQYTLCLAWAIPQLEGRRQYQAREALADRLTRMTADTLTKLMTDRDSELRRAACLAVAMKDAKAHVPDLIERIADIDDGVSRAARAGLKSLTDKDFGPAAGATDDQKRKAADEWRFWYAAEGKNK